MFPSQGGHPLLSPRPSRALRYPQLSLTSAATATQKLAVDELDAMDAGEFLASGVKVLFVITTAPGQL